MVCLVESAPWLPQECTVCTANRASQTGHARISVCMVLKLYPLAGGPGFGDLAALRGSATGNET